METGAHLDYSQAQIRSACWVKISPRFGREAGKKAEEHMSHARAGNLRWAIGAVAGLSLPTWPAAILVALCVVSAPGAWAQQGSSGACPPAARKDDVVEQIHGVSVADPYRWLEDQQGAETRAWIDAEDKCTEAALSTVSGREELRKRLTALMRVDLVGVPEEHGGIYFFEKRRADQDLGVIYERHGLTGSDQVLVDPHPLSTDHSTSTSEIDVSRDGVLMAYAIRAGGKDEVTVRFRDTHTLKDLPDELPEATYFSVVIEPARRGVYYTVMAKEGTRLFHHTMGTPVGEDRDVFGQGYGRDKILALELSADGHDLLIPVLYGSGSTRTDLYFKDLHADGPVKPIVNDQESNFRGQIEGGQAYILTNWKAPRWHVFRADLNHPGRENWKEIVPETDAAIDNIYCVGGKVIVSYTRNAASELKIFDPDGKPEGEVPLPGLGSVSAVSGRWDSSEIFFPFESFNVPDSVYREDLRSGRVEIWDKPNVPLESSAYTVEQVWYTSKDGTRVPMFLMTRKGIVRDGVRPTLLTGYGGFDLNSTPYFSASAIAWVDRGGVFAMANLRGGGEFGEEWHRAGMLEKKQNVFDDFIAAGEWLIGNHYTNQQKLAIEGGSNGGLLVGAALTERPELFRAVVCAYPLLDMLRYQKFMDGPFWVPEYGSADDPAQFQYLYAYSPYQNVKDGTKYPAVLFVTGDGDTRVAPLHARKMAARLQAANASGLPILLLYDTKSGHSGGRPLSKQIDESTDVLSFLTLELGS
jgi:prolyl oligopeptidase